MSGDIEYRSASLRFTPSCGWGDYFPENALVDGIPNYFPIFEGGYDYVKFLINLTHTN